MYGVAYGYLHVLDLPSRSFMFCIPVLNISPPGKNHSIQNQIPDHAIGLLCKHRSIITCILMENTLIIISELIFYILTFLSKFYLVNSMCVHRF